jgi:hypothetical protein
VVAGSNPVSPTREPAGRAGFEDILSRPVDDDCSNLASPNRMLNHPHVWGTMTTRGCPDPADVSSTRPTLVSMVALVSETSARASFPNKVAEPRVDHLDS